MQFQLNDRVRISNSNSYFFGLTGHVNVVTSSPAVQPVYWVGFADDDGGGGCDFSGCDLELIHRADSAVTLVSGRLHRGSPESAGYDLCATQPSLIPSGGRALVATGVRTRMRSTLVGVIKDRSGLAAKNGVTALGCVVGDDYRDKVLAGVIDADYRDEWKVLLLNTGVSPVKIAVGDRVAQVVFVESVHEVTVGFDAAEGTGLSCGPARNGGFGSTGN